jgi:hypothetical protein
MASVKRVYARLINNDNLSTTLPGINNLDAYTYPNGTTTTVTVSGTDGATVGLTGCNTSGYIANMNDWGNTMYYPTLTPGFNCYASTDGRISEQRLEVIFQLLAQTKLDYTGMIKQLGMDERLFNTALLEYALKFKPRFFIEMLSHNQSFTKDDLYNQVVKSY